MAGFCTILNLSFSELDAKCNVSYEINYRLGPIALLIYSSLYKYHVTCRPNLVCNSHYRYRSELSCKLNKVVTFAIKFYHSCKTSTALTSSP
jgi:hypothetical protein